MKLQTASFFAIIFVLGALMTVSSCSRADRFAGAWMGVPTRLAGIPGAADATATVTIDFAPTGDVRTGGDVVLSATVDVSQAVVGSPVEMVQPYQADVAATASIRGRYMVTDDDDDVVLHLDPSTLSVNVDPDGITLSENMLTGLQQPQIDSITARTADQWRVLITAAVRDEFYRYGKIDDIKVHHTDMMSCEIDDRDYIFRRIAPN